MVQVVLLLLVHLAQVVAGLSTEIGVMVGFSAVCLAIGNDFHCSIGFCCFPAFYAADSVGNVQLQGLSVGRL